MPKKKPEPERSFTVHDLPARERPRVVVVGTIEPRKNHLALLAAWRRLAAPRPLLVVVGAYHRQFLAVVFDEEFARLRGIPVGFFYLLLLVLVAVTVVLLIQVVGLILVLALLTLPAAMAGHHVHSLGRMMLIATLLGGLLSLSGLALSYGPDLPAGPVIILLAGAAYVVSALFVQLNRRRRSHGQGERNG